MHAKLQNGLLRSAPKTVQWQGHTVNNPSADKLAELGYKPVVYTDMPTDAPSLFAKVLIPDTDTIPEWEQPNSTNPYAKGDKVTHNGKTWISTADGNVWEPGVYGWEEV